MIRLVLPELDPLIDTADWYIHDAARLLSNHQRSKTALVHFSPKFFLCVEI